MRERPLPRVRVAGYHMNGKSVGIIGRRGDRYAVVHYDGPSRGKSQVVHRVFLNEWFCCGEGGSEYLYQIPDFCYDHDVRNHLYPELTIAPSPTATQEGRE